MGVLKLRSGLLLGACFVLGGVLGFFLLEPGIFAIAVLPATLLLLGLFLIQADRRTRLQRIGARSQLGQGDAPSERSD